MTPTDDLTILADLDAERIEERRLIITESDAVCLACGANPKDAPDAATDPLWLMDTIQNPDGTLVAQVLCPDCL